MGNIGSIWTLPRVDRNIQANTPDLLKSHRSTQTAGARDNELVMKGSFWQSMVAVVGNAIYLVVERFLPPRAQHKPYQIDWGLP